MATLETASAIACCACDSTHLDLIETHYDRHANILYRLYACSNCDVVFSEPRQAVGADWYQKAVPLETPPPANQDSRFRLFFQQGFTAGKLLDVGCGEGGFLGMARDHGWKVVGFDYDERKVAEVHRRGLEAHTSDWLTFCHSRPEGEFDAVTLYDVLEHVPEPRELVRETRRLLKSGGDLIITLPNANRPLPFGREEFDFPPHHFTRWNPRAMKDFLEREGFKVAHQEARAIEFSQFLEIAVLHVAMKPALGLAKRLLFGRHGAQEGSITELTAKEGLSGGLADKSLRTRLFSLFHDACRLLLSPVLAALWLYYSLTRRDGGTCLFTVAQKS